MLLTLGQYRRRPRTTYDCQHLSGQKQYHTYLFSQCCILLQELDYAVCQLRVVHAETFYLVHGQQHSGEEELVLLLERQSETVDDGSKNFEELCYAVEALSLVAELEEDVVDGAANVGSEVQEFAVNPMQRGFQKVTFPRVFRVEQFKELAKVNIARCKRGWYEHSAQNCGR